jgi:hypothetical protein
VSDYGPVLAAVADVLTPPDAATTDDQVSRTALILRRTVEVVGIAEHAAASPDLSAAMWEMCIRAVAEDLPVDYQVAGEVDSGQHPATSPH